MVVTDSDRPSTRANSRVRDQFKSRLLHTSFGSESSNVSLVVLDNQVKAWSGFKFSIPNTLTLILEYYPVKQRPLVADIVTGFSK